jgi:hypothetical protein
MTGLELQYKDKIIAAPLLDNRVISIIITQNRDIIEIIFGCMDFIDPHISRTWFNSQLDMGDDLSVSVKNFDDIHISPQSSDQIFVPYKETDEEKVRRYHSLKEKLENAGVL